MRRCWKENRRHWRVSPPEAPAELERIVMKALAKDPDERFQTAKDLLIDLKRLKQKLDVDRGDRTQRSA